VAVKVALELAPKRKKQLITPEQVPELAKDHKLCNLCSQVCLILPVGDAVEAAKNGDLTLLAEVSLKSWDAASVNRNVRATCLFISRCRRSQAARPGRYAPDAAL
jgi:CO dehydrogenase/acetyl-CoA synthase alpha subunit